MSSTAKTARAALKSKAQRMVGPDPRGTPIDASGYTPPDAEDASVQTGMRPVSPRQYKKGGKVLGKHHGEAGHHHAGRKPRKAGGRALTVDSLLNRDQKMANDERVGTKHVGGMKHGGATKHLHKFGGGMLGSNPVSEDMVKTAASAMPAPMKRKDGGKAKWIQGAIKHPGSLRKALHVAAGEKIPAKKLEKATHSKNPAIAKKANLAKTLRGFKHADGGKVAHKHLDKADELADKDLIKSMVKHSALQHKKHGGEVHHADCRCEKCSGGRMGRATGGRNIMEVTGVRPTGGRMARKSGGRAGKGKTNVNIVIAPHGAGQGANPMMANPMGQTPARPVPVPAPMPPQGMPPAMPMGAMPPAGMPPAGMPPRPPMGGMAMARKSGGRTTYPIHDGAGGGEGRLEKIKAYGSQ